MATWTIRLLGGFGVERSGGRLPRLSSRKGAALLAALALRPERGHTREELTELLWPGAEPELARNSLRQTLTLLHRWLDDRESPLLTADRLEVRLRSSDLRCDTVEVEDSLRRARTVPPEKALEHWRMAAAYAEQPLLPDMPLDWLEPFRAHYRTEGLASLLGYARCLIACDRHPEAMAAAARAIALEPLHDEATAVFMEAARRAGTPHEGLLAYRALERRMAAELGLRPSPPLRERAAHLRGEDHPMPPKSERALPALPWPLVGRTHERQALIERLSPDDPSGTRIVTLTGMGGIGKSHLAIDVLRSLADRYEGRAYFVPAAQATAVDLESRIDDAVLEGSAYARARGLRAITEYLGERLALLVIDNAEDLLTEVAAMVRTIFERCPKVKLLITSRMPLGIRGEAEARLPRLALPNSGEDPRESESVQLYLVRAQSVLREREPSRAELEDVARLCHALEGVPLAIVLAASRARFQSPREITEGLESFVKRDGGPLLGGLGRSASVLSCIAWSYDRLGPSREVLDAMTCFRGGATAATLGNMLPERDIAADLERLAALAVVQPREAPTAIRFYVLESVERYASERIDRARMATLRKAHAATFESLVARCAQEFAGGKESDAVAAMAEEGENTLAALRFLRDEAPDRAVRMAFGLVPFWHTLGRCREGVAFVEPLLATAAGVVGEKDLIPLRHRLAVMQRSLGLYEEAEKNLVACVRFLEEADDPIRLAEVLSSLGNLRVDLSQNPSGAIEALKRSLGLFEHEGHTRGQAMLAGNLGRAYHRTGDIPQATAFVERALDLNRTLGNRVWEMNNLCELAEIALEEGNLRLAEELLGQALSIRETMRLKLNPWIFLSLAELRLRQERTHVACEDLARALRLCRDHAGDVERIVALRKAVELFWHEGRYEEATRCAGVEVRLCAMQSHAIAIRDDGRYAEVLAALGAELGPAYQEAIAIGRSWALDSALDWVESLLAAGQPLADGVSVR